MSLILRSFFIYRRCILGRLPYRRTPDERPPLVAPVGRGIGTADVVRPWQGRCAALAVTDFAPSVKVPGFIV